MRLRASNKTPRARRIVDAHAQAFTQFARAWTRYLEQRRAGMPAQPPVFKKKGRSRDSVYVANDRFRIDGKRVVLPKVGAVALSAALRLPGRIMGASVAREADHWYLAVQVVVPDSYARLRRNGDVIVGVDLGITAAASLSNGERIAAPRPLHAALRRLRIRSRRQTRKFEAAKANAGIKGRISKGIRLVVSRNQKRAARVLARLHA